MKWIKFSDMKPPVGMNVFVVERDNISILTWRKEYNEHDSEFVHVYSDEWATPREIYALDFWAPVSFFAKYLPNVVEQWDLKKKDDWYEQHKNHPNIEKIKQITEDLAQKNSSERSELIKIDYGWCSYGLLKIQEISKLFKEINCSNKK